MYYYKAIQRDDVIYSCDMLRLLFKSEFRDREDRFVHIPYDKLIAVMELNDYSVEYYSSNRITTYKHMLIFRKKKQVITLGLEHNHMTDNVYNNFLEFNPNKVDMSAVKFIMKFLKKWIKYNKVVGSYFEIGRWDLSVDIPVDRGLVKLLKQGRREYKYILGSDGSLSEYSGKRNTNGFTKVYDKKKESKLNYDLTRIEITIEGTEIVFPDIHLKKFQQSLDLNQMVDTDRVIVEMLRRLDEEEQFYWFRQLGRGKQEKLRPYVFSQDEMFEFNRGCISEVIDIVSDISFGLIEEGGSFIGSYREWSDFYCQQYFAPTVQSASIWSKIDEKFALSLFE